MKSYTRTASLVLAIALLAAALTQSSVSAAPRTPEQIVPQAKQVVVGYLTACALMEDGSVWCWGNNELYQVGVDNEYCLAGSWGIRGGYICTPQLVDTLPGKAKFIHATRDWLMCAVMEEDGALWCWGPPGDIGDYYGPRSMGLLDVKEMQGDFALTHNGDLYNIYGYNLYNIYGERFILCDEPFTYQTPHLWTSNVRAFGWYPPGEFDAPTMCVTTKDGRIKCWGANGNGKLGTDLIDYSCTPIDVFNPLPHKTFVPAVSN